MAKCDGGTKKMEEKVKEDESNGSFQYLSKA